MDATTLVLLAYLLGVISGAALMAVSVIFVITQRGLMGNVGVKIPKFELVNAPVAVVFLVVGAGLFGGTLYLLVTQASEASTPAASTSREVVKLDADLISASSSSFHAPDRGITYSARNTLDSNRNTAWNADGVGIGESLHFEFARPARLSRIDLMNGYTKDRVTFAGNARLRNITIITDAKTIRHTLRDSMAWQTIRARFGLTTSVTIEIESVYEGREWNDAALTDIRFWGSLSPQ